MQQPPQPNTEKVNPMFEGLQFTPEMNDDMIIMQIQQRMQMQMQQQSQPTGVNQLNIITVGQKE